MSPRCGVRHPENGAPCAVVPHHDGEHQAYWKDRLYSWPDKAEPRSCPAEIPPGNLGGS